MKNLTKVIILFYFNFYEVMSLSMVYTFFILEADKTPTSINGDKDKFRLHIKELYAIPD